jgi:hypothetical protein
MPKDIFSLVFEEYCGFEVVGWMILYAKIVARWSIRVRCFYFCMFMTELIMKRDIFSHNITIRHLLKNLVLWTNNSRESVNPSV